MAETLRSGKARYVGVSNFGAKQMEQFMQVTPIHCHQMALAWVPRKPPVDASLVGIRRPQELEENVHALDRELSQQTLDAIEVIAQQAVGADTELPTAP